MRQPLFVNGFFYSSDRPINYIQGVVWFDPIREVTPRGFFWSNGLRLGRRNLSGYINFSGGDICFDLSETSPTGYKIIFNLQLNSEENTWTGKWLEQGKEMGLAGFIMTEVDYEFAKSQAYHFPEETEMIIRDIFNYDYAEYSALNPTQKESLKDFTYNFFKRNVAGWQRDSESRADWVIVNPSDKDFIFYSGLFNAKPSKDYLNELMKNKNRFLFLFDLPIKF